MKLKKRLAMLLATAMITTSVPMVALAKDTSISQTLVLLDGNTVGYKYDENLKKFELTKPEQFLTFDIDIGIKSDESIELYLEGENIEISDKLFNAWAYLSKNTSETTTDGSVTTSELTMLNYGSGTTPGAGGATGTNGDDTGKITIKRVDNDSLIVTLTGGVDKYGPIKKFRMPLVYKAKGGTLKLKVESSDGRIEEDEFTLSKGEVKGDYFTATIKNGPIISTEGDGNLGDIEITEVITNALRGTDAATTQGAVFRVTLDSSDLIFDDKYRTIQSIESSGSKGLSSALNGDSVKFVKSNEDETIGYLIFNAEEIKEANAPGYVTVKNIAVEAEDDDVSTGDVDITVELLTFPNDGVTRENFNKIVGFDGSGDDGDFTFDDIDTLDESDKMDPVDGVSAEVKEDGIVMSVEDEADTIGGKYEYEDSDNKVKIKFSDPTSEYLPDEGKLTLTLEGAIFAPTPPSEYIKKFDEGEEYEDEDGFYTKIDSDEIEDESNSPTDQILVDENEPHVIELELMGLDDKDNFELEFYVVGNPGFDGDIKLIADGSKWDDPMTAVVGEVSQPTEVSLVQPINVIENEKVYPGGIVTIAETEDRMFDADEVIAFKIEDLDIEDAEVTADNGMEIDSKISDGHLLIQIQKRSSKDPATITISDIRLDGNGYIPVGEYAAYIGGQGIHVANTPINFEESSSSKLMGQPDAIDHWDDKNDFEEYEDMNVNLEDYEEDKDEIFAAAFSLEEFLTSTRPEPEPEPEPEPPTPVIPVPEPDPIPQPDDVKGEDGNYGLPDLDIRISNGIATVNYEYAEVSSKPVIVDGVTMVGVADLAKLLGIPRDKEEGNTLNYYKHGDNPAVVTLRLDKRRTLEIVIDSYEINIYDYNSLTGTYQSVGKKTLIKPAQILEDNNGDARTFVPMRPIGEALGFDVSWDPAYSEAIFSNIGN